MDPPPSAFPVEFEPVLDVQSGDRDVIPPTQKVCGVVVIRIFLALSLLLVVLSCSGDGEKNVLLITIDTMRADRLGCYGASGMRTPHMDRLARRGALFQECVSPIPETSPAHASILTGLYPKHHGMRQNGVALNQSLPVLPDILGSEGFTTAAFVAGFPLLEKFGFARGFDHYDDYLTDGFTSRDGEVQRTERIAQKVVDAFSFWLEREDGPFFAWIHLFDPHAVYAAPGPYRRMYYNGAERDPENRSLEGVSLPGYLLLGGVTDVEYPVALYEGEVSYVDHQIGRLIDLLRVRGVLARTLVILTGDHGESMNEHGYYFGHSRFLYEPSLHVPLIMHWPGRVPAGVSVDGPVSLVDLVPTILDLLEIDGAGTWDGSSLVPLLFGSTRPSSYMFLERSLLAGGGPGGVRKGDWKFVTTSERGEELYNLENDPGELTNLLSLERERAKELRGVLADWRRDDKPISEILDPRTREVLRGLGYVD